MTSMLYKSKEKSGGIHSRDASDGTQPSPTSLQQRIPNWMPQDQYLVLS